MQVGMKKLWFSTSILFYLGIHDRAIVTMERQLELVISHCLLNRAISMTHNLDFKVTIFFKVKYLENGTRCSYACNSRLITHSLSHSLTHCCAWPAEGHSVLHIERSWPAIQAAPTDRPVFFQLLQPISPWTTRRALPVSSGRSAGVGFYWQLQCLRSRCVLR